MTPATYNDYVAAFNRRDYDAICSFFAPEVALHSLGHTIRRPDGIRAFYRFFHQYVVENITVTAAVGDDRHLFAEGVMRLTGLQDLTQEVLSAQGFPRFTPVPKGLSVEIPLFLHYDLKDGLVTEIRCAGYLPPAP
ncbi:MAG: nuclear transport factor 2 family protein [Gammaproteobacteria bacterium]|nr:nuclear transport factor 2 family protein [Gammaproteobacteria bacterium]